MPGALNLQLRRWMEVDYHVWQWEMNALYAAYSFPNLLMPIAGGMFPYSANAFIIVCCVYLYSAICL